MAVRPEGAEQWIKIPHRELSIDLEADERRGRLLGKFRQITESGNCSKMRNLTDYSSGGNFAFRRMLHVPFAP
jgi:hypothetical protein